MHDKIFKIILLLSIIFLSTICFAWDDLPIVAEVGDILYFHELTTDDLSKEKTGHTAIYIGKEKIGDEWVDKMIDIFPGRSVTERSIYSYFPTLKCNGAFTHASLSSSVYSDWKKQKRKDILKSIEDIMKTSNRFTSDTMNWDEYNSGVGATSYPQDREKPDGTIVHWVQTDSTHRTVAPFTTPTINYDLFQKGQSRSGVSYYVCVGLAEKIYELNGLDIVSDTNEFIEASYSILFGIITITKGYVFFPKIQKDYATPSVPKGPEVKITEPANNSVINKTDIILKGEAKDVSGLREDKIHLKHTKPDGSLIEYGISVNLSDNTFSYNLTNLANGEHKFELVAYDKAGNISETFEGNVPVHQFTIKILQPGTCPECDNDGDGIANKDDPDDDNDGMPDDWENKYTCVNPWVNDANEDADGDGVSNYDEYVNGSDPCDAKSIPSNWPQITVKWNSGLNLSKIEGGSVHATVIVGATDDNGLASFYVAVEIWKDTYRVIYSATFPSDPATLFHESPTFEAEGGKKYLAGAKDIDGHTTTVEFTLNIKDEECRGMINDHPDDSESVKSIVPEFTPTPIVFGNPVTILMTNAGVPGYAWRMVQDVAKEESIGFLLEFDAEYLAKTHPLLVISSGGLIGTEKSEIFKDRLKRYVENGGTIVCFTTQHGYEFSALPLGEQISGYGWSEDQSCQSKSSYIETKHVIFSGQSESVLDVNIDGYFTRIPDNAKVLLRRTKNGAPALIEYSYGRGKVILGALYSDWAWSSGQLTEIERILIRDLIAYAKNPNVSIKEFKPEEWIEVDVPVVNTTQTTSDKVVIEILNPKREIIEIKEYAVSIVPSETRVIKYSGVNRRELGIYQIQYALYSAGNVIQDKRLGERFAVRIDIPVGEYKIGDFVMWVVSQAEQVAKGESAVFNIFVQNNTDRDFNKGMIAIGDHGNTTDILLDIDVGAKSTKSFIFQKTMYLFATLQFALYPAGSRIGTSLYSGNIASAERGINVVEPEVNVDVIMDKRFYNKSESAKIALTITNVKNIDYNAEVEIVVVDSDNRKMFGKDISINLSASGTYKEIIDFVIPNEAKSGICLSSGIVRSSGVVIGQGSASFELPYEKITTTTILPTYFSIESANNFTIRIQNTGLINISNGSIKAELIDPEGISVWLDNKIFNVQAGMFTDIPFSFNLTNIKFGNYYLKTEAKTENRKVAGANTLPCSVLTELRLNKSSYRIRDTVQGSLDVINNGIFKLPLKVIFTSESCNFIKESNLQILPGAKVSEAYNFSIPDTITSGQKEIKVKLELANSQTNVYNFSVSASELVLSLGRTSFNAGEEGVVDIENTGGVDTGYSLNIKIKDSNNILILEKNENGVIKAGEIKISKFEINNQAITGEYRFKAIAYDVNGKTTVYERFVYIKGISGNLTITLDKSSVKPGEAINVNSVITTEGNLERGKYSLMVYKPERKIRQLPYSGLSTLAKESNILWLGKDNGEVIKYDKTTGETKTYTVPITDKYIYQIVVDDSFIWIGTREGLIRMNKADGGFVRYDETKGLSSNYVISLADDDEVLWVGTSNGLNKFEKDVGNFIKVYTEKEGLISSRISCVAVDGDYVWIGSINGANRINKNTNVVERFTTAEGLNNNKIEAIVRDYKYVWFGTNAGINYLDKVTGEMKSITTAEGLISNKIYSLGIEASGVWIGTYEGMSYYDRATGSFKNYRKEDGLPDNWVRYVLVDEEKIWIIAGEM